MKPSSSFISLKQSFDGMTDTKSPSHWMPMRAQAPLGAYGT